MPIESAEVADDAALSGICLRTAAAGSDASDLYSDPELPGNIWVLPYTALEPRFAFVLRDAGRVLGYVVGARDTATFSARLDEAWWPDLRRRYAGFDARTEQDRQALARVAQPVPFDQRLRDFPAHLHINLLPEVQRGGWGRKMIERELLALAEAGAPAVHLEVNVNNQRVIGFYERLDFTRLFETGKAIYMGRSI